MYQEFFGLNSKPFSIVPDTRFLFLSDRHREAIAHLVYALNEKNGFVQLTGEVGVGKTMACRYILANIPDDIDVALILNPRVDEIGLLRTLCQELDLPFGAKQKINELTQLINRKLLDTHAAGRHTILIIDEAQNLPKQTLEQIRLLTNLETDIQKLLRIILIGQPELGELLSRYDMRQVAQRITSRYHLGTLAPDETDEYISHRLQVAGCQQRIFSKAATRKVHQLTDGTPRLINLLCDRALIGAYSQNTREVNPAMVKVAAKEALPFIQTSQSRWLSWLPLFALLALLIALAGYKKEVWSGWLGKTFARQSITHIDPKPTMTEKKDGIDTVDLRIKTPVETKPKTRSSSSATELSEATQKLPTPTPLLIESVRKQVDLDFRLGIPSRATQ